MQGSCQRRDLKRIFCSGHTSPVRRNRRGQINDVRARKFSARSASTRPSIVVPRGGTQPISAKAGVAGRKGLSLKYRVANVGHFTHLPVPAGIAPGKLSSQFLLQDQRRLSRTAQPLRRFTHPQPPYPFARPLPLPAGGVMSTSLVRHKRGEPRRPRSLDTIPRYPCCHGSRSDNRLESVANAHTAADLHVRPVSKTALVSRSWAPRTIKRYPMRDFWQSV